jgi:hypothetical protein
MKDLESLYKVELLCKKNGFFVIKCNLHWQVEFNVVII